MFCPWSRVSSALFGPLHRSSKTASAAVVGRADAQPSGTHQISFYCDALHRTVAELKARGVEFTDGVADYR